jgi:aromatic-L-amino-acid decarboxylase
MESKHSQGDLDLSLEEVKRMVALTLPYLLRFLGTLPHQPMHHTAGGRKTAAALREPMPEDGTPFEHILRMLFGRVFPLSLNTASPGYLAYVPGGGLFQAAMADLISNAVNRYVGVWMAAPGLVQLESNVIDWFREMIGFPSSGGGVLTTGGSMANLMAIIAARRDRLPPDFLKGVIYTSDQAHHSVNKAAMAAGFPLERVRILGADKGFRLLLPALTDAIANDTRLGLTPFMVVASAGTTNTGAVDDLKDIADIAQRHQVWLHVDAAYGGFFMLTERGRDILRGIEAADSVTLDPHKGMFLPYGTGCLLVRNVETLRRAFRTEAAYMPPSQDSADRPDFADLSFELSRDARGLRVWLPLKMHGASVFRRALDEKMDLARQAAERLRELPNVEVVAPPTLSLLAFRVRLPGLDETALEQFNRRVMRRINARQRVLLTGTTAGGIFLIRICVLCFRTHQDRMDMCMDDVRDSIEEVTRETPPQ